MESNPRYVYASTLTKINSSQTTVAMESILEQNITDVLNGIIAPIEALGTDGEEPKFRIEFRTLINKLDIPMTMTVGEPGTHEQLARPNRFHDTFHHNIGERFFDRLTVMSGRKTFPAL